MSASNQPATFGPRIVLGAAIVGFAIGVVITLAFAPLLTSSSAKVVPTVTPGPAPTPAPVPASVWHQRITKAADNALGPNKLGCTRVGMVRLQEAPAILLGTVTPLLPRFVRGSPSVGETPQYTELYNVTITFELNTNDFGPSWTVKSVQADVFRLLKTLYTKGLPVAGVSVTGIYRLKPSGIVKEGMHVVVKQETARRIPWRSLTRQHEGLLWNTLDTHVISSTFSKTPPSDIMTEPCHR